MGNRFWGADAGPKGRVHLGSRDRHMRGWAVGPHMGHVLLSSRQVVCSKPEIEKARSSKYLGREQRGGQVVQPECAGSPSRGRTKAMKQCSALPPAG